MQSVILLFSPLLWSAVLDGIGKLARGTWKLYKTFPSCAWIFLSSTLWLWSSRVLKSKSHLKPRNFTLHAHKSLHQPLYTPFTLSVHQNGSEQPVFTSLLLQCAHGVPLGLLELQAAPSLHLLSSWERVLLSPQCTGSCVPVPAYHDSSPNLVATFDYLMHPDSTATHPHLHTWQLCVHSCLSKRRISISYYPRAPMIVKKDKGG